MTLIEGDCIEYLVDVGMVTDYVRSKCGFYLSNSNWPVCSAYCLTFHEWPL